eukprot:gene2053-18231_t
MKFPSVGMDTLGKPFKAAANLATGTVKTAATATQSAAKFVPTPDMEMFSRDSVEARKVFSAISDDDVQNLRALLNEAEDPQSILNMLNKEGSSPLYAAAYADSVHCAKLRKVASHWSRSSCNVGISKGAHYSHGLLSKDASQWSSCNRPCFFSIAGHAVKIALTVPFIDILTCIVLSVFVPANCPIATEGISMLLLRFICGS